MNISFFVRFYSIHSKVNFIVSNRETKPKRTPWDWSADFMPKSNIHGIKMKLHINIYREPSFFIFIYFWIGRNIYVYCVFCICYFDRLNLKTSPKWIAICQNLCIGHVTFDDSICDSILKISTSHELISN